MSKKGITGHDEWVVTEALATALVALEQLPEKHQPHAHMDDLEKLLAAGCQPGSLTLRLARRPSAGCFPTTTRWPSIASTASGIGQG